MRNRSDCNRGARPLDRADLCSPHHDANPPHRGARRAKPGEAARTGFSRELLVRVFAVLAVTTLFGGVIFNSTTIAMPKIFDERLNALVSTTLGIGILVSLVYAFAAMAQLVVGHILDRGALKSVLVAVIGFQLPLLLAAAFFNNYVLLAVALAMMFFVFGQIPINDAMVAAYTDEAWRARVFGVRYVFSFGASAFAVPLVALMYRYSSDFRYLFFTLAAMAAVMLAAAVLLPSRARREIGDRPRFPTPSAGKRGLSP